MFLVYSYFVNFIKWFSPIYCSKLLWVKIFNWYGWSSTFMNYNWKQAWKVEKCNKYLLPGVLDILCNIWTRKFKISMFCLELFFFFLQKVQHCALLVLIQFFLVKKSVPARVICKSYTAALLPGVDLETKDKVSKAKWRSANYCRFHWDYIDNTLHR